MYLGGWRGGKRPRGAPEAVLSSSAKQSPGEKLLRVGASVSRTCVVAIVVVSIHMTANTGRWFSRDFLWP